jgi:hypothetical protein
MTAPLVLFVFNRLGETRLLIESLLRNKLAAETNLYIFSDAAKLPSQQPSVEAVRQYITTIEGFKHVEIEYAQQNKGLAHSVIEGVSKIIGKYGRAIVLEDDLIVASDFLEYMNSALKLFADREDIWSIAGYSPALNIRAGYAHDTFLFRRASSHGWATWVDRWQLVDWSVTDFRSLKRNRKARAAFNQTGNDMFRMLELQQLGRMNSWAIRFCYTQYKAMAYTVYPIKSKVQINGYGAGATHTGLADSRHRVEIYEGKLQLEKDIPFDHEIAHLFTIHQNLRVMGKIGYFLRKHGWGYAMLRDFLKRILGGY